MILACGLSIAGLLVAGLVSLARALEHSRVRARTASE